MAASSALHVTARAAFVVLLAVVIVLLLFPFYWMLNSAFKSEPQLQMTPATFVPRSPATRLVAFSGESFRGIFADDQVPRGVFNSLVVAGLTTVISLAVGSFAAFALGKLRFRGRTPILYLVLVMTMFPQISVLSGLYSFLNWTRLGPIPSMILSYMLFSLPFTVWLQTAFFRSIPSALLQAGYIDGASPFQVLRLIMLPLTGPALVTAGLLVFINAWNEYLFALTFTSIAPLARTIPVVIALFHGQFAQQEPFGEIMAAGVTVTVPLIVLVMIFQKRIVSGLTAGAVKG
jgi:trehalose/maltose transport system permease protein